MPIAVVTGGMGFIGSHLCKRLRDEGYRVISLDCHKDKSQEHEGVEYITNFTNYIQEELAHITPDLLFHLGEYSRVEISLHEPDIVFQSNLVGTYQVLEYWRSKNCKLIYTASSTRFGEGGFYNETPYSWSKYTNTQLILNYARWYALNGAITYLYNVYGPGEKEGKYGTLIEKFLKAKQRREALLVRLPGTQARYFTHVEDVVDGLWLVAKHARGDAWAIGNGKDYYSVQEVADLISPHQLCLPPVHGNRNHSTLNQAPMQSLGWSPKRNLKDYIQSRL